MSYYKYVVTAQKPTATHFAVKGAFTGPNDINLVLGKGNRIEIYTITPDGLKPTLECNIYGTIMSLHLYLPKGRSQASLFILTTRHKYCVLTYSAQQQQIVTEATSEIGWTNQPCYYSGAPSTPSVMDPSQTMIATLLYPCTITLIIPSLSPPFIDNENTTIIHSTHSRNGRKRQALSPLPQHYIHLCFPDKRIIAMTFLDTTEPDQPTTMMVLYDNSLNQRYLQVFTYDKKNTDLKQQPAMVPGDIVLDHIEQDAILLIAVPAPVGGVLLVSGQCIRYLKPNHPPIAIGISSSMIQCHAMITNDGSRYFLGDTEGHLYLLVLNIDPSSSTVRSLGFMELGDISIPSCLVYLDNDVLYVGSSKGDSQLVHVLRRDSIENRDILQVIENFPSLGPVIDFCVADLDKQGQPQLITCSGAGKDSSLRIIRSGVGLNQLAAIEMNGVKATWALRPNFAQKYTETLIISFANETRILQLQDNAITPLSNYSSLALNERTLVAGNVMGDMMIQVTEKSVRLMGSGKNGSLLDEWRPSQCSLLPSESSTSGITVASLNPTQCVISIGFGYLIAFFIQNNKLVVVGETRLEQEISCIDITPTEMDDQTTGTFASSVIAVGLWQQVSVLLLRFDPSLAIIAHEPLTGLLMPRSILMARLENICYLLVALGDGQVYNFRLDNQHGRLWDKKRSFLGKLPIVLGSFTSNGTTHVFAASDKPSVIHSRNQKLVYSNVNLKDVRSVTSFSSPSFPDAVALTTRDGVVIGQMEEIQKLHITKIPTLDTPRRIVYQETSRTFGVITEKMSSDPYTLHSTTGGFEVLDDQNFTVLDRIYFKQYERPLSALSTSFEQDVNDYYVIATGKDSDAFETTSSGRILVLQLCQRQTATMASEKQLVLISQIRTMGMVEQLVSFKGKLIASVRGKLEIYEWKIQNGQRYLEMTCSHQLASITESLTTHGDYIFAGDITASVTALKYDGTKQPPLLEEVGADEAVREVTSLEALSDTLAIGAERDGHLFVVERSLGSTLSTEHGSTGNTGPVEDPLLETVSEWHLGELVQRFRFGTLGNIDPDIKPSTASPTNSHQQQQQQQPFYLQHHQQTPTLSSSTNKSIGTNTSNASITSSPSSMSTVYNTSTLIFATANGAIGIIADLSESRFKLLWHMQNNMTRVVKSIGHLSHSDWRSVVTMGRKEQSSNFIDGDLIESFLDLTPQQMQQVVDGHHGGKKLDRSVEDLCKVVEELMSLHS
ncbi:mono-functional DNA-alkylating methyl methanesulfonate N-term-domain-containing protein [Halteromyces radiatus]|uniref:mono-functional DNA-alkylating methyl methanesulfonate N-term-domain-containing protein n=1 Tax=Halteromyces radiatus TaxID=101107 RepID=UPI00221F7AF4|nr:mono-functional DNA-alkylating methyl methanesulfonate N-term-domain-containing protein [Halteromyces radiatus]KAI8096333.1 mono-functional DNA-alkylating methyl methanesulfonate N-term-domain-containing protein [Halteromyces radiatus]